MAHIPAITPDQAPLSLRDWFKRGQPGALTATLAHVPELLETAMPFIGQALGPLGVDERTKEIAILRTSALQSCPYCVGSHTVAALDSGLSSEQVRALRGESDLHEAFTSEDDLALLAWTDVVARGPGSPEVELVERMGRHFEPHQLVELTLCIGATLMLNRFCTALDLPLSDACRRRLETEGLT